jgi:hypothetical protein
MNLSFFVDNILKFNFSLTFLSFIKGRIDNYIVNSLMKKNVDFVAVDFNSSNFAKIRLVRYGSFLNKINYHSISGIVHSFFTIFAENYNAKKFKHHFKFFKIIRYRIIRRLTIFEFDFFFPKIVVIYEFILDMYQILFHIFSYIKYFILVFFHFIITIVKIFFFILYIIFFGKEK